VLSQAPRAEFVLVAVNERVDYSRAGTKDLGFHMQRVIAGVMNWEGSNGRIGRLRLLREVGIEYVELLLSDELTDHNADVGALKPLREALEQAGTRLSSCHLGVGNPLDADVVAQLENKLSLAHQLGACVVVAGAGFAGSDEEHDRIIEHLHRLGDRAADKGITIALDTQPGLMQDWRSMRATIEQLDHPHVRINFDPGNLLFYNPKADDETSLARIAPLVAHVHLHDSAGFSERAYGSLGRGAVNLFRIREILDVCGFTGPYGLVLDQHPDHPEPSDVEYLRQLHESMENLRWCGYLD
jgi:L-ribulose-5-phosphate 3-epimerase